MLKRLLFPSRPAFLLPKTAWKAIRDPGVKGMDIRVRERCRPGCPWISAGGAGRFICHAKETFMPCFYILSGGKRRFFQMVLFGAMAVFVSCKHKQHITRHINKSIGKKHDRYIVLWSRSAYSIYGSYFSNLRLKEERTRQLRSSRPIHLRS